MVYFWDIPLLVNMYTTHQVKMGTHVLFDEVHFTIPASQTPFAAQTLQLFDYSKMNFNWGSSYLPLN